MHNVSAMQDWIENATVFPERTSSMLVGWDINLGDLAARNNSVKDRPALVWQGYTLLCLWLCICIRMYYTTKCVGYKVSVMNLYDYVSVGKVMLSYFNDSDQK